MKENDKENKAKKATWKRQNIERREEGALERTRQGKHKKKKMIKQ